MAESFRNRGKITSNESQGLQTPERKRVIIGPLAESLKVPISNSYVRFSNMFSSMDGISEMCRSFKLDKVFSKMLFELKSAGFRDKYNFSNFLKFAKNNYEI